MSEFHVQRDIEAPASAVWNILRDFGGLTDWMPGLKRCDVEGEGIGATRRVYLSPEVFVGERLEKFDDSARSLSYAITEGPLPVQDYLATITVRELGEDRCHVDWTGRFALPDGMDDGPVKGALEANYGGALKALQAKAEA